ncbi:MAG: acetate/propionate family kinase, partial [Acidimicrobiales bacterium]
MRVLAVNAGSSTLKLRLVNPDQSVEATLDIDPWDGSLEQSRLAEWLGGLAGVDAIGHRVVHGGDRFPNATRIDGDVLDGIGALTSLAPLHHPRALAAIESVSAVLPDVPAVACFDTAFHSTMPDVATTYALPRSWRQRWPLRRYGFHGLSHAWASRRAAE